MGQLGVRAVPDRLRLGLRRSGSLTSFWWLAMIFASVVPIALSVLDRPGLETSDERKVKEGELLHTLAERREITPPPRPPCGPRLP